METLFLLEIMFILVLSLFVLILCNYLKIPNIIGYIFSGILAGPFVLSLVESPEIIELFAEIGVIFLLFTIGIQFSLKSLIEVKKLVVLGGSLQLVMTTGFVVAAALLWGTSLNQALFFGFLVSLSSTAIVMKVLQERGELESVHGKTSLSILIFQDLMIIPLMFIIPLLAGDVLYQAQSLVLLFLTGFLVIGAVLFSSRYLVPWLLFHAARVKSQELFLLTVIVICFSISWIISQTGVSLALGAFIAGLVISESEFSLAALNHIMPFRDLFAGFFFISIGMLLDVGLFLAHPMLIIGLALGIIFVKFFTGALTTVLLNLPRRTGLLTGLALCQIGEFSFILASAGEDFGLISGDVFQVILDVTLITMLASPFVIAISHRIAGRISDTMGELVGPSCEFDLTRAPAISDHLIIVGYGLNGRNVARAAKFAGIPYRIVEMNPDTVREECERGEPIFYGDATQRGVLDLAGIRSARILVVVIGDRIATQQIVQAARRMNAQVHILVRTRFVSEVRVLKDLGANEVIPEEFETSIEIFTRVLQAYLVSTTDVNRLVDEIRAENYEMLRIRSGTPLSHLHVRLPEIDVASLRIGPESPIAGKRLSEIPWRREKGISLIAIIRRGETILNPGGDALLQADDQIVVVGNAEKVRDFVQDFEA